MGSFPAVIADPLPGRDKYPQYPARYLPDWFENKKKIDQEKLGFDPQYWCIKVPWPALIDFLQFVN